jgi:NTE family protein
MIQAEREMAAFGVSSKLNADWGFLMTLFELGRRTADAWLERNIGAIGAESSVDLQSLFF